MAVVEQSRRSFLRGAALLLAAPAIVRVSSLMPVKAWAGEVSEEIYETFDLVHPLRLNLPGVWVALDEVLAKPQFNLKFSPYEESLETLFKEATAKARQHFPDLYDGSLYTVGHG